MVATLIPIADCPSCGTTLEIRPGIDESCGENRRYVQVGNLQIAQPAVKLVRGDELLHYHNERAATHLAGEKWLQEGLPPLFSASDDPARDDSRGNDADGSLLDSVIPPPLAEQCLPLLALIAVILGFFALGSHQPITVSVILLNPVLVGFYLNRRSARRQRAKELMDSKALGRAIVHHSLHRTLKENWQGLSA